MKQDEKTSEKALFSAPGRARAGGFLARSVPNMTLLTSSELSTHRSASEKTALKPLLPMTKAFMLKRCLEQISHERGMPLARYPKGASLDNEGAVGLWLSTFAGQTGNSSVVDGVKSCEHYRGGFQTMWRHGDVIIVCTPP